MISFVKKPRSVIPWRHMPVSLRVHTILSWIASIYLFLCLGITAYIWYNNYDTTIYDTDSIILLIDGSLSMSATDIAPNRYTHAIQIASGIVTSYDASYSTVVFGAVPIIQTPFSTDTKGISTNLVQHSLGSYLTDETYLGSAPGNALLFAYDIAKNQVSQKKYIIMFSDGNINTGYNIESVLSGMRAYNTTLIRCSIGSPSYTIGRNYANTEITNTIDVENLTHIIQTYGGNVINCNDTTYENTIRQIHTHITPRIQNQTAMIQDSLWIKIIGIICILYLISTHIWTLLWYVFRKYSQK